MVVLNIVDKKSRIIIKSIPVVPHQFFFILNFPVNQTVVITVERNALEESACNRIIPPAYRR